MRDLRRIDSREGLGGSFGSLRDVAAALRRGDRRKTFAISQRTHGICAAAGCFKAIAHCYKVMRGVE